MALLRGLLVTGIALLGGCLSIDYTLCGDVYCAAGEVCTPDQTQCVFPEQLEKCNGQVDGTFCTYSGVPIGACASGVCLSQTTGSLPAPTDFVASDGASTDYVSLSWAAVDGATGYRVWRDSIAITDVTTASYQDTGATTGGVPTAPLGLTASQGTNLLDVQLAWNASTSVNGPTHTYFVTALASSVQSPPSPNDTGYRGAYVVTGYEVSLDNGATFSAVGSVTSYTDTTAPAGSWSAAVTASDGVAGKVTLSVSAITEILATRMYVVRAISGAGAGTVATATGSRDVGNPSSYQWQWSDTSNGTFTNLAGATTASYDDTTGPVITGRFYRCVLGGSNGAMATVGPDFGFRGLAAPASLVASDGTSTAHIALTWNAVDGATGYRIFRNGSQLTDVTVTSYDDTAAPSGGAPDAPASFTASQGTSLANVSLSWTAPTSAVGATTTYTVAALANTTQGPSSSTDTGYRAALPITSYEVSLDNGTTFTNVGAVTSYSDTTAPVGSWTGSVTASDGLTGKVTLTVLSASIAESFATRTYRVRAINAAGSGTMSTSATGYRDVGDPTGYQWQWSDTSNGTYADIASATTTPYDYTTGPVINMQYFRCVLTGANGATGTVGPNNGYRALDQPTGVVASDGASSAQVTITWNTVYGATGYRVFRSNVAIADVTAASYDDTSSATAGFGPNAPQNFTATRGTYTDRVELTWNASTSSPGNTFSYGVAALAGTTQGPGSSTDTGYRAAFPITYELQINGAGFNDIGAVTSYSHTTAAAGTLNPTVTASDGKAAKITLTASSSSTLGATQTYNLRSVNTAGTGVTATDTGYRSVGTTSYQWQRSAGPSDASYSNIVGATTTPYDDATVFPTFEPRFYRCVASAAGAASVTSAADSGWRGLQTTPVNMWITGGRFSGVPGVRTSLLRNGLLYLGGNFAYLGPRTGTFSKIGASGTGTVDLTWPVFTGNVNAAASDGSGGWYVAGNVSKVNGVASPSVVHVTAAGTFDTTFAPGTILGTVYAIAVSGGVVYIGGSFTSVGAVARNNIAALDGTTGAVVTAWNPGAGAQVNVLLANGTKLYAGGTFTSFGGGGRTRLAAVSLSTGALDAWNPGSDGTINELGVIGSTIYVQGSFTFVGGQTRAYLAAVDATTGVATSWNPSPNGFVKTMVASGSTVYVSGVFGSIGGASRGGLGAVDATTGTATGWNPPLTSNVYRMVVVGSAVYVGGGFAAVGNISPVVRTNLAAFDASTGAVLPWDPGASDWVSSGMLVSDGTSVFVGSDIISVGGVPRNKLAAIDLGTGKATSWNPDVGGAGGTSVDAIAISTDNATVYVGGSFTTVGGLTRNRIASVSASTGAVTSWNPNSNSTVRSLALGASVVYAGGDFGNIGGQARASIAALDSTGAATAWNPSADGAVITLLLNGSTLYAGGDFFNIGVSPRSRIAAIDTSTGTALNTWDPGADNTVRTIVPVGSNLFVGGAFSTIGAQSHSHIAILDAATGVPAAWAGSTGSDVGSIAVNGNAVFHCGTNGTRVIDLVSGLTSTDWFQTYPGQSQCTLTMNGTRLFVGGSQINGIDAFDP